MKQSCLVTHIQQFLFQLFRFLTGTKTKYAKKLGTFRSNQIQDCDEMMMTEPSLD